MSARERGERRFTKAQARVLAGCFIAYAAAYIGRLNLSQALPGIAAAFSLTGAQAGALQTATALAYAAGQLIVGLVADRLRPRPLILTGLMLTALVNGLFGLAGSYPMMVCLWAVNGLAQSMLWTPIIRTVATWFAGPARARAAFIMSASTIIGHLLSWTVAGLMSVAFTWRLSFLVPCAIMLALWPLCLWLIREGAGEKAAPTKAEAALPKEEAALPKEEAALPLGALLTKTGLWAVLVCAVVTGFVRDGISTWTPTMLAGALGGVASGTVRLTLIIPLLSIPGLALSRLCFGLTGGEARKGMARMLLLGTALTGALMALGGAWPALLSLLLGLSCAIVYGNTPMLTAMMPLEYIDVKRVALVSGIIDASVYVGSALAGVLTGYMQGAFGQGAVSLSWTVACGAGVVFALASLRGRAWLKTYSATGKTRS